MSGRYRVVGCSECDHLWILESRHTVVSTECPRCERRFERSRRRALATADDVDVARELRSRLLEERARDLDGAGVQVADVDDRGDSPALERDLPERYRDVVVTEAARAASERIKRAAVREHLDIDLEVLDAAAADAHGRIEAAALRARHDIEPEILDELQQRAHQRSHDLVAEQLGFESAADLDAAADEALEDDEGETAALEGGSPGSNPGGSVDRSGSSSLDLTVTEQPPVGADAYAPTPPFGWNAVWCELLERGLEDRLVDALRDLASGADSEAAVRERLLEAGVTALDDAYADALARGVARGEQALWRARRLTRQLGGGQTTLGPMSTREDVVDGPLQLLAAADVTPTVAIGLPDEFWEAHRSRRSRFLELVGALARVCDVRLCCSGLDETKLVREHADQAPPDRRDIPLGVSEGVQAPLPKQVSERAQEGAVAALEEFGDENPHYDVLRALADADGQETRYHALYSDSRLSRPEDTTERKRTRIRQQIRRLADEDLVERFGSIERRVALTPAGRRLVELLNRPNLEGLPSPPFVQESESEVDIPQQSGSTASETKSECSISPSVHMGPSNECDSSISDPEACIRDIFASTAVSECLNRDGSAVLLPRTHGRTRTTPATEDGRAGSAAARDVDTRRLSYAQHHAVAAAATSGDITLSDRRVADLEDPRSPGWSFNPERDEVVAEVEVADLMAATGVRSIGPLTCDDMFAHVLTPERLAASGVLENSLVQRKARCLGYLKDGYDAGDFVQRLRREREALLALSNELREAEGDRRDELAATLCRQSHGLRGTIEQILDQLGVDLVYHLRLPDYRHDRRDELLRWLSRAATIGARKGHYSAHRLGWEPRTDKRNDILGEPTFTDDYSGTFVASWVLSGPGLSQLAPRLERGLEADLEFQDQAPHRPAPEFTLEADVVDAYRQEAVDELLERVAERKHLHSTRATTATLYGLCGSLQAVATALIHGLGAEDPDEARDLQLFEVRRALGEVLANGVLEPADLLPDLAEAEGRGVQAIVAALLQADAPLSQRGLARAAGVTAGTVRKHRDVLEALGLLDVDEGANAHHYRLRLPFRAERRDEGRPRPAYAPAPTPSPEVIPDSCPDYYYFYTRSDLSKATHCWRPPAAVFTYLSAADVSIESDYGALWERLVDDDLRLQDVIPPEHRVRIEVLRRLVGAADVADFRLSEPLALQTELGRRPPATQLSIDTAAARATD